MTIAMSEQVDAEPCDVLRGGDGPVYFLLGGRLYVVHEILGRWIEPDVEPRRGRRVEPPEEAEGGQPGGGHKSSGKDRGRGLSVEDRARPRRRRLGNSSRSSTAR